MWIDDEIFQNAEKNIFLKVWQPDKTLVVLGSSQKAEKGCLIDACQNDQVPILKRAGGGGAVVLYEGCLIISLGTWVKEKYQNQKYFSLLNQAVISFLIDYDSKFSQLSQGGISDIIYKDKKIAGTSLFRSKNYLLYQASIIVHADFKKIEKYLTHPSKEPEYRKKRSHHEFISSLENMSPLINFLSLKKAAENQLDQFFTTSLMGELVMPVPEHIEYLQQKVLDK